MQLKRIPYALAAAGIGAALATGYMKYDGDAVSAAQAAPTVVAPVVAPNAAVRLREFTAKVIGADKRTDIALIKIDAKNLQALDISSPPGVKQGEWVVAIGSPFGFENSISAGIVSGVHRALPGGQMTPFIQTDVAVNPGNSGGPLLNSAGQGVGGNSPIYSRSGGFMGLSFAIPADVAAKVADQLKTHGKGSHGRLGVGIQQLNQSL